MADSVLFEDLLSQRASEPVLFELSYCVPYNCLTAL